ncbi:hypothetical protein Tco_1410172 [Tanacetum coccineum]
MFLDIICINTSGKGIRYNYGECKNNLSGYSDADWAKCLKTRKSVTGYCVFFNNCLISWKSKKQNTISKSSTEAEYRSLSYAACEIIWIQKLLLDLNTKVYLPIDLQCDNKYALQLAINLVFHERSKHFEIDVHFIREKIAKGLLNTKKIYSSDQTADILTKHLPVVRANFHRCSSALILRRSCSYSFVSQAEIRQNIVSSPRVLNPRPSSSVRLHDTSIVEAKLSSRGSTSVAACIRLCLVCPSYLLGAACKSLACIRLCPWGQSCLHAPSTYCGPNVYDIRTSYVSRQCTSSDGDSATPCLLRRLATPDWLLLAS